MHEKRKAVREPCFARVLILEQSIYGYIADISQEGVRVRIPGEPMPTLAAKAVLVVSLEEMAIPPFRIVAEFRWRRDEPKSTSIGFRIVSCLDEGGDERLESILEYYRLNGPKNEDTQVE